MPEPDETPPPQRDPSLPTNLGGIDPGELLARGMQSAKLSGGGAHGWLPPPPAEVAHLFPNYEILSMLGRGGMGAVYKARQTALDRLVAIKLLPLEISVDAAFADRFRREARAMAKLNHPHIISVFDFGQTAEGHLFFAMEFVEGANLHDIIHGPGLAPDQALSIAVQICTALAYAHGKGVVHRDMKPANVMIDTESQVKVADFGLARLTDTTAADFGHTMTGTVMGTPDYMAPEQKRGMNVDHRADIYSLGVMLYEMLCRETPQGAFELPSHRTGCDPRLDAIVLKAMQQTPERRYQSTQEMKADVESARTPLPASPPPTAAPRPLPKPLPRAPKIAGTPESAKKSRAPLGIASAAALAVLLGAAVFISKHRGKDAGTGTGKITESTSIAKATKEQPFVNTLGMKFVPVPITGGPTGGQRVLFSIWETRVQDYEVFAKETKREWPKASFEQGPTHPAVNVRWENATAFCAWLTERERKAGKLGATEQYRLPSDHEWSCAVGIGEREEAAKTPEEKNGKLADVFPWGSVWPPPAGVGNFAGEELQPALAAGKYSYLKSVLPGYRDAYPETAPAGSFAANGLGLCDLSGNAWEWCEDWFDASQKDRVLRGASWNDNDRGDLVAARRGHDPPTYHGNGKGFRLVIAAKAAVDAQRAAVPPAAATKDAPFVNTLGMKFVPVPITGGPTGGQRVLFSVWETRVQDYAAYARVNKVHHEWQQQQKDGEPVGREPEHPVCGVSWDDANAFCQWLTNKEGAEGKLPQGMRYRLPTDEEWSRAVGLAKEDGATPKDRSGKNGVDFPWGLGWPPPEGKEENYADSEWHEKITSEKYWIAGYTDGFATTAPVGSFAPNEYGFYDLGGNVIEWCEDLYDASGTSRVQRGGAWNGAERGNMLSSMRVGIRPSYRSPAYGFRVALAPATSEPAAAAKP